MLFAGSQDGWLGHWADDQQAASLFLHHCWSKCRENPFSVRCVFVHKEITILTCHCEVCEVQCVRQALAGCIFSSKLERYCVVQWFKRDGHIKIFMNFTTAFLNWLWHNFCIYATCSVSFLYFGKKQSRKDEERNFHISCAFKSISSAGKKKVWSWQMFLVPGAAKHIF